MYLILEIIKFQKYIYFIFGFLISLFLFDFTFYFCDDDDDDYIDKEEGSWFTDQEKEDFKIIREIFLNVCFISIFLASLLGFTFLTFCFILIVDITSTYTRGKV